MLICHGSNHIIEKPIFGIGKRTNDYGVGFYCTESLDLAKEWSVEENRDGFANTYSLETKDLRILDLNDKQYSVLHWITILVKNRVFELNSDLAITAREYLMEHFSIDVSNYDIITGYRADDSYFTFAKDFLNNTISLDDLGKALYLGNLGTQIVLKSEKAFSRIEFVDSAPVSADVWYPKKETRDKAARTQYRDVLRQPFDKNGIFILDIVRNGLEVEDVRI